MAIDFGGPIFWPRLSQVIWWRLPLVWRTCGYLAKGRSVMSSSAERCSSGAAAACCECSWWSCFPVIGAARSLQSLRALTSRGASSFRTAQAQATEGIERMGLLHFVEPLWSNAAWHTPRSPTYNKANKLNASAPSAPRPARARLLLVGFS
jgi:hypothetical protein